MQQRTALQNILKEAQIPTAVYYPKPLHLQSAFSYLGYRNGDLQASEDCAGRIFSLPIHPYLVAEKKKDRRHSSEMKKKIVQVRNIKVTIKDLKAFLKKRNDVSAFLFGSAAIDEDVVNDLDILVLLSRNVDKNETYIDLIHELSDRLNISEEHIDLLFFDIKEADLSILSKAVNKGILLKNDDPNYLSEAIDNVSRFLLENEAMMIRGKKLRQERLEVFSDT